MFGRKKEIEPIAGFCVLDEPDYYREIHDKVNREMELKNTPVTAFDLHKLNESNQRIATALEEILALMEKASAPIEEV